MAATSTDHSTAADRPGGRLGPVLRLGLTSFLLLFLELALIRYLPSQVRVLSYFTNLVLLASFLGLGCGALLARVRVRLLPLAGVALAVALGLGRLLSGVLVIQRGAVDTHLWTIYVDLGPTARVLGITPTLVVLFVAVTAVFVPLGQELGLLFQRLRPLTAYSVDIVGSLAGSIGLTALAAASIPPPVWFAVAAIGILVEVAAERRSRLEVPILMAGLAAVFAIVEYPSAEIRWTPYYRVQEVPFPGGVDVTVNASLHQSALDLSPERCRAEPAAAYIRDQYAIPHRLYRQVHGRPARSVVVLGAGSGNDVEVALQMGVERVVAVEIDPVIAAMGHDLHPNRPYDDPRVEVHVTDARSFLRATEETFDLVLFGTLDSQTLMSGMSNIRLDNYVYTVESLAEARRRVADDGLLALFFMSAHPWIADRLTGMVGSADGQPPLVFVPPDAGRLHVTPIFNLLLVAGPATDGFTRPSEERPDIVLASDDWPYLYLSRPSMPEPYRSTVPLLVAFSTVLVLGLVLTARRVAPPRPARMTYFLALGAGFMLLETKCITELSLLFGSTWKVNAFVISAVLITILAANLVAARWPLEGARWPFPLLIALLLANRALPPGFFLSLPRATAGASASLFFALPIFAAGLLFARRFKVEPEPDRALGYNLIGAMVGGFCEYLSMVYGIRFLYLLAIAAYLGAWAADRLAGAPAEG